MAKLKLGGSGLGKIVSMIKRNPLWSFIEGGIQTTVYHVSKPQALLTQP